MRKWLKLTKLCKKIKKSQNRSETVKTEKRFQISCLVKICLHIDTFYLIPNAFHENNSLNMKLSQSMQSFELTKDWCNELEGICFEELTDQRAERQLGQLQMKLEGIRDSIVNYRHIFANCPLFFNFPPPRDRFLIILMTTAHHRSVHFQNEQHHRALTNQPLRSALPNKISTFRNNQQINEKWWSNARN